jgi:hypothetical protein
MTLLRYMEQLPWGDRGGSISTRRWSQRDWTEGENSRKELMRAKLLVTKLEPGGLGSGLEVGSHLDFCKNSCHD